MQREFPNQPITQFCLLDRKKYGISYDKAPNIRCISEFYVNMIYLKIINNRILVDVRGPGRLTMFDLVRIATICVGTGRHLAAIPRTIYYMLAFFNSCFLF